MCAASASAKVETLRARNLDVRGGVQLGCMLATVWALRKIMALDWRPDAVFGYGFSEHIWGRRQLLLAEGVPRMVHVEHNSRERYTPRRLKRAVAG